MPDLDSLRAIADPAIRARCAAAAIAPLTTTVSELSAVVRDAVREMRETRSLAQVAAELGVSRGRVQQLEKPR